MYVEFIDRDIPSIAQVQQACDPYEEYAQCGTCGWLGCVADFAGHVQAKHPNPDVSKLIYRR